MYKEDEIYEFSKSWFSKNGFLLLAGQPPNGSDNLPVIEIKNLNEVEKGSKGSYKPDIVCANKNFLILVECKVKHDGADEQKLLSIFEDTNRIKLLYEELNQRNILKRKKILNYFNNSNELKNKLRLCLAHNGKVKKMKMISTLYLNPNGGEGKLYNPLDNCYTFS